MNSNHTPLTLDYTATTGSLADDDPRSVLARAAHAASAVVALLDATTASSSSPCSEWDALDVARHMVAVIDRATAGGSGQSLDGMAELADVDLATVGPAIGESMAAFRSAWTDDRTLAKLLDVPWGTFPGAAVLSVYTADLLVHTWDLAVAIGVRLNWPEADVRASLDMAKAGFPDNEREHLPFGPVVRTDPAIPMFEQLAAWVGRDVGAWSGDSHMRS